MGVTADDATRVKVKARATARQCARNMVVCGSCLTTGQPVLVL